MDLPNFNEIGGERVLNKTSFEQWRKDVGGFFGQPNFKTMTFDRGSQVWVVTEADFLAWYKSKWPKIEDDNTPNHTYPDGENE